MSVWKMLNIPHIQMKYYCILDKQKNDCFFPKDVAEGIDEWTLRFLLGVQIKAVLYKLNLSLISSKLKIYQSFEQFHFWE